MSDKTLHINRNEDLTLIGIHNQDPNTLYIQFSIEERYFIYERNVSLKSENIHEQLFGLKEAIRDSLRNEDKQILINKLRFTKKTRRDLSAYRF